MGGKERRANKADTVLDNSDFFKVKKPFVQAVPYKQNEDDIEEP